MSTPTGPESDGPSGPSIPETERSGNPPTILLVEDEESLRLPVTKILRRRGFLVIESGDGPSAIDLFRTRSDEIDAVLLDLTLPSMSGGDVLAEMSRICPSAPVILTSAHDRETVLEALEGQTPWAYIRKPYSAVDLAELLRAACDRKERTRTASSGSPGPV